MGAGTGMKRREGYSPADYKKMIMAASGTIAALLPKGMDADRITRIAWLACHKDEKLLRSDPVTLVTAIVQAAQLGLEVGGPLQQSFLVPYWNKDKNLYDVQMQPGFRGFIELMVRGASARDVYARVVRKQDQFELEEGSEPKIFHKPALDGEEKDEDIIGAYAIAVLPDGSRKHEWVPISRIREIRDRVLARQKGAKSGPWVTDFVEMCRKTPVRVLAKYVRITPELAAAIELDTRAETGTISAPLDGFDTPDSIVASVRDATVQKAEALRDELVSKRQAKVADEKAAPALPSREEILAGLRGLTVPQLHAAVRERAKVHGFTDLADINALVGRVTGLATYQEITTAEEAADVLHAAAVTAEEMGEEEER